MNWSVFFVSIHPKHIILPVGQYMENQSYANSSEPPGPVQFFVREQAHDDIHPDCHIGMQWMESHTHAVWVENWIGEQVVKIYQHGAYHHPIRFCPVSSFEKECQQKGCQEM